MTVSRRSGVMSERVSMTPLSSPTRRPLLRRTTPYPVCAVPGSMPNTIMGSDSGRETGRLPADDLRSHGAMPDFEAEGLLKGLRGNARHARLDLLRELHERRGVPLAELRRAVEEG